MKTWICREPGRFLDTDPKFQSREEKGDGYVVVADKDDNIIFPGVDSCLAIAVSLSNGSIIGGHVGEFWPPNQNAKPLANAQRILTEMLAKPVCRGASIKRVLFVGDPAWWDGMDDWETREVNPVVPKLALPGTARAVTTSWYKKGNVDVLIDGRMGSRTIIVQCHSCTHTLHKEPLGGFIAPTRKLDKCDVCPT